MSTKKFKLPTDGCVELINRFANDFVLFVNGDKTVPNQLSYIISSREEPITIEQKARIAAMSHVHNRQPLKKFAFDTRRIDQETQRIPRSNLQYWHRSDEFITEDQQNKINLFTKLYTSLTNLKNIYGTHQEWHNSYVRTLYETVSRTLRIKQGDSDIFGSQLAYLEQLLDARYRLTMSELSSISESDLEQCLLKKDENLLKRGVFFSTEAENIQKESIVAPPPVAKKSFIERPKLTAENHLSPTLTTIPEIHNHIVIDGKNANQDALGALFSNGIVRKDGERSVTRTITITINDSVEE